jgi:hypothetical protein
MRLGCLQIALLLTASCAAEDDGIADMLPEDIELELAVHDALYMGFPECPAQDAVVVTLNVTAPPDLDIERAALRAVDVDDTVSLSDLDVQPFPGSGEDEVRIEAGTTGTLRFNVTQYEGPTACEQSTDVLDPVELWAEVEIHGSRFEVVGPVERQCGVPAPHTCT